MMYNIEERGVAFKALLNATLVLKIIHRRLQDEEKKKEERTFVRSLCGGKQRCDIAYIECLVQKVSLELQISKSRFKYLIH